MTRDSLDHKQAGKKGMSEQELLAEWRRQAKDLGPGTLPDILVKLYEEKKKRLE